MKFQTSELATKLLSGLSGIEIGGSAHNSFDLDTKNVDYTDEFTIFKEEEVKLCGEYMPVDIVSYGDNLPLKDESQDFVISSHVIEHFWRPITAIKEWHRVTKKGGYVFIIAPHKLRTFDKDRPITNAKELMEREGKPMPETHNPHRHWSVWDTESFVELCQMMNWNIHTVQDIDDKVGNGFTVVLKKPEAVSKPDLIAWARLKWAATLRIVGARSRA